MAACVHYGLALSHHIGKHVLVESDPSWMHTVASFQLSPGVTVRPCPFVRKERPWHMFKPVLRICTYLFFPMIMCSKPGGNLQSYPHTLVYSDDAELEEEASLLSD